MENPKAQLAEKLQTATNILVTVSSNPSVDQLAACISMTLWLNKVGKHATAVFSGDIPNTLEFLQPESTIEKNTDSLRDFIIALDKSKADKLRYKVEDRVVKIFITPYRTSLSADDLEFSQGDFNVDAIVALGVTKQEDLDNTIVSHGRILHDAIVTTINTVNEGDIGSINWRDTTASSLSEMVYDLCEMIDAKQLDPQIATAILTGIVAETNRFGNKKTTPNTMNVSAALMSAGANQQLVANKLDEGGSSLDLSQPDAVVKDESTDKNDEAGGQSADGTLEIDHGNEKPSEVVPVEEPAPEEKPQPEALAQPITESEPEPPRAETQSSVQSSERFISEPPKIDGLFTANSKSNDPEDNANDSFSLPPVDPPVLYDNFPEPSPEPQPPVPEPPTNQYPADHIAIDDDQTLTEIEEAVDSPHLDSIRSQVVDAFGQPTNPQASATAYNPASFEVHEHDEEDPDAPPQVPPPIVPPDYLPPAPPQQP